jgi:hypothetical protein
MNKLFLLNKVWLKYFFKREDEINMIGQIVYHIYELVLFLYTVSFVCTTIFILIFQTN